MLLVTGITGHTGRFFLQELIDHNYQGPIRCIVRQTSDTSLIDNSGLNIEKAAGDLNDPDFVHRAMAGVDTVMHIFNIRHSPLIVEAAVKCGVKRAVLIHTTGIYSHFKQASEEYKQAETEVAELTNKEGVASPSITILRPSMIYGDLCDKNMSKFIKMIDRWRVMPVINRGNSYIQPVNARDLGTALYTVLMSPKETRGKAYTLSGEKPISMIEVFKLISKELNKKTFYLSVPLPVGVALARIVRIVTAGRMDYIEKVQRMGENRSYSHANAVRDFGYQPMSLEKGIQAETVQYLKWKAWKKKSKQLPKEKYTH